MADAVVVGGRVELAKPQNADRRIDARNADLQKRVRDIGIAQAGPRLVARRRADRRERRPEFCRVRELRMQDRATGAGMIQQQRRARRARADRSSGRDEIDGESLGKTPRTLHDTPTRWLVLAITLVVAARIVYGLWRGWMSLDAAGLACGVGSADGRSGRCA